MAPRSAGSNFESGSVLSARGDLTVAADGSAAGAPTAAGNC
jgi:hypothetical protein